MYKLAIEADDDVLTVVFDELDVTPKSREELRKAGVKNLEDLRRKWRQLREGKVRGVKRIHQDNLCNFVTWYKHFEDVHEGQAPDVKKDFNEDDFLTFTRGADFSRTTQLLLQLHNVPSGSATEEDAGGKALYNLYLEGGVALEYLAKPEYRARFLPYAAKQIQNNLSENLKNACQTLNINIPETVGITLERLLPATPEDGARGPLVVAGKTQSGKSAFKAVVISVCKMLRIPSILMTKEVAESKDLHGKLVKYLAGSEAEHSIFSPYKRTEADIAIGISAEMNRGGTLVIPDTFGKINYACRVIESAEQVCKDNHKDFRFVLIVDEADAMYRTVDGTQKMEMALQTLRDFKPVLEMLVSATPVPILLLYKEEFNQNVSMHTLEASHDYVGVDQMQCLQDDDELPIYLDPLSHREGVGAVQPPPFCDSDSNSESKSDSMTLFPDDGAYDFLDDDIIEGESHIPNTSEKVMTMYDHALSAAANGAEGVLVLDCTSPRVFAENNMFQKATRVQNKYRSQGQDIFAIVNVGKGTYYRAPGRKDWKHCTNQNTVSDVIAKVDEVCGLKMPIFVYGYSKMKRCISYRSGLRVPTHIIVYMGQGHSVENLGQAVGRGTFTGKDLLERNGHESVTCLMDAQDFAAVKKYVNYVQEIQRRLDEGEQLDEAMRGSKTLLPDNTNYLQNTNRKTGQRAKKHDIGKYHHRESWEDHIDEEDPIDLELKKKYWDLEHEQRILRVLCDLTEKEDYMFSYATDDIIEAYNDHRFDDISGTLSKAQGRKALRALKKDAIIRAAETDCPQADHWHLNRTVKFLRENLLNPSLIETMRERKREAKRNDGTRDGARCDP